MNKNFAEWFRVVDIKPNHQRLQDRWQGIENYVYEKFFWRG